MHTSAALVIRMSDHEGRTALLAAPGEEDRAMAPTVPPAVLGPFLAAADEAARLREDVDRDVSRELMEEAAVMLHNSLALDDLDPHDLAVAVEALAADLTSVDPGAAVRARAAAVRDDDPALHDAGAVRGAYLVTVAVLQL